MAKPILVDRDRSKGIATITFNRPEKYNAINEDLAVAFLKSVQDVASDSSIRCLVLEGAGKAFMSGGDISDFAKDIDHADVTLQRILRHMHPALIILERLPIPVIAAVHGPAAGAGLSIVLSADYAICSRSASFIFAYDRLATVPDCGGTFYLRKKLGPRNAFALMLKSQTLDAEQAQSLGIVNQVFEDSAYQCSLNELIEHIASGPTKAFGLYQRLIASDLPLSAQLEAEKAAFMEATYTHDFKTAIRNFKTKTSERFSGR